MLRRCSSLNPLLILALFILVIGLEWGLLIGVLSLVTGTYFLGALAREALPAGVTALYVGVLYTLVMATLWVFWSRLLRRSASEMGLVFRRGAGRHLLVGIAFSIAVAILYYGSLTAAGFAHFERIRMLTGSFLLLNLLGAFAMALTEEVFFRGFVLRLLVPWSGPWGALGLSSLLFAASHMFHSGPFSFKAAYGTGIFLLGLTLARGALAFETLWFSVGLHWGLIFLIILHSVIEPLAGSPADNIFTGLKSTPAAGILLWGILALMLFLIDHAGRRAGLTDRR